MEHFIFVIVIVAAVVVILVVVVTCKVTQNDTLHTNMALE